MDTSRINHKVLLSTLWVVILFNMVVRDRHEFLREGYIAEMMSIGMPQEEVLLYGFMSQAPILMILLSRILKQKANQWYNTVAAVITSAGLLSTLPSADMDDIFFVIIQNILLLIVMRVSWKLTSNDDGDFKPLEV